VIHCGRLLRKLLVCLFMAACRASSTRDVGLRSGAEVEADPTWPAARRNGYPFRASSIYCMISYFERHWGVHFAMGGMGALVKGLVGLIEGQGSSSRTNADVAEITDDQRRATGVRLASG
jgi:phytoene dehydrogenase-like protein